MAISRSEAQSSTKSYITIDSNIRGGVPCVGDGNWPIAQILDELASGLSVGQLVQNHTGLTLIDIQLALKAAALIMRDPVIDWSALNLPELLEFREELEAWQSLSDDALDHADS